MNVADHPIIAPGEVQSYCYNVQFDAVGDEVCCKNVHYVHSDNAACSPYYEYSPEELSSLPKDTSIHYHNDFADLVDAFDEIPTRVELNFEHAAVWHFCESGCVQFVAIVSNEGVRLDQECCLENAVISMRGDSGGSIQDTANNTVRCHSRFGNIYTIGYWKNHDGTKRNHADMITVLIDKAGWIIWLRDPNAEKRVAVTSASQAEDILSMENQQASNGVMKLHAQLLAAKLNILNGAYSCAIDDAMFAADSFLAGHKAADWSNLTAEEKQTVLDGKTIFDEYNHGLIGPGHWD